ncbi:RNA polymerase sigma factor SigW [Caldalkalibacillus mannanilyticus]|uniref:RNA polymerase sigma factor SigW n=1 Tax=Caldalkalibacillus mannanilyticus TaxID=1418 RepID=UPI00046AEC95|nr:RNA polymerase sigma factor SigW [Caldalkalibacillus mannanilyticus]
MDTLEQRLIKQALAGDRQAFEEIVELYKNKIFQVAYRMLGNRTEAEDIGQETFLRVYANLSRYDQTHKFSTWIYRIATNLCIDRLRKRQITYSLDQEVAATEGLDMYSQIADKAKGPEAEVMTIELQNEVQQAIDQLPIKYKSIMILRYIEDLSLQEISEIIDLPVTTIKTRIHRGREALKKLLKGV